MKPSVTAQQIGTALRARREAQGIKVRALAARAAVRLETLVAVESGARSASVAQAQLVARALGTTLVAIVHEASKPQAPPAPTPGLSVEAIAQEIVRLPDGRLSKVEMVLLATVRQAMATTNGNQSAAARLLGMERKAFVRRLARADRIAA